MENPVDAKQRIIQASIELFSQKGFDATRVSDIASAADVNKALIYYYFKNKQDILDYMVESLLNNALTIAMDFVHAKIVRMVEDGRLEIQPGRLHFSGDDALRDFLRQTDSFFERVVDYVLNNKEIIRILMLESLKNGKHQNALFRLLKFMSGEEEHPALKTMEGADRIVHLSHEMTLFRFFFSLIPIVSFAAYYEDFKTVSNLDDDALRRSFLSVYQGMLAFMITGSDILLRSKNA